MRLLTKRLSVTLRRYAAATTTTTINSKNFTTSIRQIKFQLSVRPSEGRLVESPWSATQLRGARFSGSDVRPGNVIERRGKIYEVVKAQHTTQGRGGAIIQVELRDVDSGNKVNERLRTDETVEKIYVQEQSLEYLYTDDETRNIVLMEPKTYGQLEVPPHLFGDSHVYLQEGMKVTVQLYDERPLAVSIPQRVTCTVAEAAEAQKGSGPTPYKKVQLDNGRIVQVPAHILAGDRIVIDTTDNSYCSRMNETWTRPILRNDSCPNPEYQTLKEMLLGKDKKVKVNQIFEKLCKSDLFLHRSLMIQGLKQDLHQLIGLRG